jgi:hypothetical protein
MTVSGTPAIMLIIYHGGRADSPSGSAELVVNR